MKSSVFDPSRVEYFANISDETMKRHEWVKSEDYEKLLKLYQDLSKSFSDSIEARSRGL